MWGDCFKLSSLGHCCRQLVRHSESIGFPPYTFPLLLSGIVRNVCKSGFQIQSFFFCLGCIVLIIQFLVTGTPQITCCDLEIITDTETRERNKISALQGSSNIHHTTVDGLTTTQLSSNFLGQPESMNAYHRHVFPKQTTLFHRERLVTSLVSLVVLISGLMQFSCKQYFNGRKNLVV